jgi:hypothetical protein
MSRMLDEVRRGSAMLGSDTEVTRAREHRPLSRGSSDGPQPYQGRPSVGPVPPSRCGPATLSLSGEPRAFSFGREPAVLGGSLTCTGR